MASQLKFDGPAGLERGEDHVRLAIQLKAVKVLMLDGIWRTLAEIGEATHAPHASVSARLRDLRKPRFGSFVVDRRRRGPGTFEYRVLPRGESSLLASPQVHDILALQERCQRLERELKLLSAAKRCSSCKTQLEMFEDKAK